MSFQNRTEIKRTRRTRQCDWCGEKINEGDPSVTHQGKHEGDFYHGRYHPECDEAIARWWKAYGRHDEFPEDQMNRGGIEEKGELEKESIPLANA
jgi:hypothetical protein